MRISRRKYIPVISVVVATVLAAGCGVDYALPEEYLSDGELLSRSMEDAVSKLIGTPSLTMGGPYVVSNLDEGEEDYSLLYDRFEDALSAALGDAEVAVTTNEEASDYVK
jgi:hypothetical protein